MVFPIIQSLINKARRLITGLPRYTHLDALKSCGGINDISELVSTHYNIQEARIRTIPAGRFILAKLGNATPPWEHIVLTDGTPLPQRIQSTGRRLPFKRRHLKYIRSLDHCTHVIYVDAYLQADHSCTVYATAWYNCNTEAQARHLHTTTTPPLSTEAELQAITDYARDAFISFIPTRKRHTTYARNPSQEIANPWHDLRSTKAQRTAYLSMAANPLSIPKIPSQHFSLPASLDVWTCPDTTISPKHALELWKALLTFIRDPTAPPVGDRLLPATAKRIRPPPPSSTKALKP
ncbi:hypothetical protein HPB47_016472 [Ixodes persulcatus]|uniref:Uncharacterized protein n=1 Tax=Ixodes persulcatus TaxID=34615 RepID=A0AC60QQY2_IXOPE|nr:hypothetical protein HPB47_016472 [Ixodes persulcatus]